jgi:hypothetical protein
MYKRNKHTILGDGQWPIPFSLIMLLMPRACHEVGKALVWAVVPVVRRWVLLSVFPEALMLMFPFFEKDVQFWGRARRPIPHLCIPTVVVEGSWVVSDDTARMP